MKKQIEVRDISKKYQIIKRQNESLLGFGSRKKTDFWALNDINIDVYEGDLIAIIGSNGAGKSTLLKLLSRITAPTTGRITINGKLSSLLEVGTGFHPDLSGRDNIYLNGSLLGMKKWEIDQKLEEMVEFSGISAHIDTPVKHYSSGMAVRLGFAVAAHLNSEILIIDEVLAVGDAAFQAKCIGKMDDITKSGRSILFVSHNMSVVQQICKRGILLKNGKKEFDGSINNAIEQYSRQFTEILECSIEDRDDFVGDGNLKIKNLFMMASNGETRNIVKSGDNVSLNFSIQNMKGSVDFEKELVVRFTIYDQLNNNIAFSSNFISSNKLKINSSETSISCEIKKLPLMPGVYFLSLYVGTEAVPEQYFERALRFEVVPGPFYESNRLPEVGHSSTLLDYRWFSR